jgi:hypothetical protein
VYNKNVENIIGQQICPKIILKKDFLLDGNYFIGFSIGCVEQTAYGL